MGLCTSVAAQKYNQQQLWTHGILIPHLRKYLFVPRTSIKKSFLKKC
jgi:hypothetical protein